MTDKPVPLLTKALAQSARQSVEVENALQALADGRTVCAHVLSEEECLAEYRRWVGTGDTLYGQRAWLASRRAAGLVAEKKEGGT